ncbi:MAG: hypothetical protein IT406_01725 [Candidatus Yanofskybacteria bacterium]|nr:hypothetical protein [Candidatus Yanofskybacteria bacterium]
MNKRIGIAIGVVVVVLAAGWFLKNSRSETVSQETPATSDSVLPSPTPLPSTSKTPAPSDAWKWYPNSEYGFKIAYPVAKFPEITYTKSVLPLGGGGEQITQVLRQKGPSGWMAVGVIDRPVSLTNVRDGMDPKNVEVLDLPTGKGVRFTIGDDECAASVFHAPLGQQTLRIAFAACSSDTNRIDKDIALQERIVSSLELTK